MSWDWVDRDLTEWAKRTLPEFLLISMQDPNNKDECIARTPWQSFVVCVGEVQIDGEAGLSGKHSQSLFHFELDIGIRLDIEREGKDDFWPGVVQMVKFDNFNMTPPVLTRLEELPKHAADEVDWYVREGMGRRYLWHGLARWHAYAVKKWTKTGPPKILDPYREPEQPPKVPPFALPAPVGAPVQKAAIPFIGKKSVQPVEAHPQTPPTSDDESAGERPTAQRFERYPFLPSMLAGLGGSASAGLRTRRYAAVHPEWFDKKQGAFDASGLTAVDIVLDKAQKKRAEYSKAAMGRQAQLRAAELCEAIERGDLMKVFAKLDDETVNCPHPETGLCPAHYCTSKGSKEMLQMIIEGKADLNCKDASGQTPLMVAAKKGSTELSRLLLDCGADATEQDVLGRTAADMVKVQPVEDRPLKNWREKLSGDPIPEDPAAQNNELRDLIDERERPKRYGTLLITALGQRDHRTAQSAILAGGDVNMANEKGDSPLIALARGKWKDLEAQQAQLAELMLKAAADVNAQNGQGNTALHYAAHKGVQVLADTVLQQRADPAVTNLEGNTALMYAAHGGHEAICTALLEACSPIDVKNTFGLCAEETARRRGFTNCSALIQAYRLAPKRADGSGTASSSGGAPKRKEKRKEGGDLAFDYSKWNALEKEMQEDEALEESARARDQQAATKRPVPRLEDLGPEAFGLPPDTPWPPPDPSLRRKGPFDYSRWDKIVDDIEKRDKVHERFEHFQKHPQYEVRDGEKMQVIF